MARLAALGIALLLSLSGSAPLRAQPAAPTNLDFEAGAPGELPTGWMLSTAQPPPGVGARIVTDERQRGNQAVLLTRDPAAGAGASLNLLQLIDATPFRGRRVRYRMAVRPVAKSTAQMWMRIEGPAPQGGTPPPFFLDTMEDRPITDPDWHHYEIVGDVPPEATRIIIGIFLPTPGQAWADDGSFESVARPATASSEAPRPITRRGLANLMAFARLLGYVRYFHPSDAAARTDWDAFAIAGVRAVESSADGAALTQRLAEIFRPVAPTVVIAESGTAPKPPGAPETTGPQLAWRHVGFGLSTAQTIYRSERVPTSSAPPVFSAELGGGVTVRIPLTAPVVTATPQTTAAPATTPALTRGRFPVADRATRLGAVMLAWTVFQHSYPYFDDTSRSWSTALSAALQESATDTTERDFVATLRRMTAALHDGQARVVAASDTDLQFSPPLLVDWIEGALLVTAADASAGAQPGDVVVTVDGTPAPLAIEAVETFISGATPQWRRARAVRDLLLGPKGTTMRLRLERGGMPVEVTVTRDVSGTFTPSPAAAIREPESGIFYLDLARLTPAEFSEALSRLTTARGLIFDLRQPPPFLTPESLLAPLLERTATSPQVHVPQIGRPDREATTFVRTGEWRVEPRAPRLTAPAVFLAGPRSIGYAESLLAVVEEYSLGRIVGEATAGTDGMVNRFVVPGDYTVFFTGAKVLRHDGRPLHGIGITPGVPVAPTRAGIAAGRDEVFDRALDLLRTPPQ